MSDALAVVAALREAISQERSEAVESVRVERLAWARFVRANDAIRVAACLGDTTLFAEEMKKYEAARQALRDLGVDVDALMEET